jgi:hypothetical protein
MKRAPSPGVVSPPQGQPGLRVQEECERHAQVCSVLNNQPRLSEQILMVQNSQHPCNNFHLRKD